MLEKTGLNKDADTQKIQNVLCELETFIYETRFYFIPEIFYENCRNRLQENSFILVTVPIVLL